MDCTGPDGSRRLDDPKLPEPLRPLARRNGLAMSHAGFGSDFDRLFATMDRVL